MHHVGLLVPVQAQNINNKNYLKHAMTVFACFVVQFLIDI